jgi:hypothetical protein
MVACRLPDGNVVEVGSNQECAALNGGEAPSGAVIKLTCFIRNVLTRALSEALIDIGFASSATGMALNHLDIGNPEGGRLSPDEQQPLNPELRADLAGRITDGIMLLARTFGDTVDFRDSVLMETPRGRELASLYYRHLDAMYGVASGDLTIVHKTAITWLAIHPYVAAILAVTRGTAGSEEETRTLTDEQFDDCKHIFARFREATQDEGFVLALNNLEDEFDTYQGLSAAGALEQLRSSPPRQQ